MARFIVPRGRDLLEACRELRRTAYPDGLPTGYAVATPGLRPPRPASSSPHRRSQSPRRTNRSGAPCVLLPRVAGSGARERRAVHGLPGGECGGSTAGPRVRWLASPSRRSGRRPLRRTRSGWCVSCSSPTLCSLLSRRPSRRETPWTRDHGPTRRPRRALRSRGPFPGNPSRYAVRPPHARPHPRCTARAERWTEGTGPPPPSRQPGRPAHHASLDPPRGPDARDPARPHVCGLPGPARLPGGRVREVRRRGGSARPTTQPQWARVGRRRLPWLRERSASSPTRSTPSGPAVGLGTHRRAPSASLVWSDGICPGAADRCAQRLDNEPRGVHNLGQSIVTRDVVRVGSA
jgi:hypothetical protein